MIRDSCFIIGSGPSLLDLSGREKQFLHDHPRTLSLNQFLIHWKLIGILPRVHMMADGQFPAIQLFVDTVSEINRIDREIKYFVHEQYFRYFPDSMRFRPWKHAIRKRLQTRLSFGYRVPWRVSRKNVTLFCQVTDASKRHMMDEEDWFWAKTIEDPLYFSRGTLTSAINLASILWPETDIKLVGVDLNSYGYFFDPKRGEENREEMHQFNEHRIGPTCAAHHRKSHAMNTHATAVTYSSQDGKPLQGIQAAFPRMTEELLKTGNRLQCSTPGSLLVKDGICPYTPILDE